MLLIYNNIKKNPLIILSVFFLVSCVSTPTDNFNINQGISVVKIDEKLKDSIQLLNFKNSNGIIFPQEYAEKKFGNKQRYFTPNSEMIKETVLQLKNQYCIAIKNFRDYRKEQTLSDLKNDTDKLKEALKYYIKQDKLLQKNCPKHQEKLDFSDKQFIGLYNEKGEKLILIQIINFKNDPYNLKPTCYSSWIDGWHGWFETNLQIMHYNLETKKITVNDNI
ncbi:hypothetical protein [Chryseobacterium sp. SIMBA_038]|uniref:hypothetical protein n=2 Tax=Bacteria TaxID=2 RepID=UPI00397C4EF4